MSELWQWPLRLTECWRILEAGWGDVLSNISPYAWGSMGVAFGLAFSVVGAAWCVLKRPLPREKT
jgi:hypothetical protein